MYNHRSPPPTHDQYPMRETHFSPQPTDRRSPFVDPYEDHAPPAPTYDNQPLLRQHATGAPMSPYAGGGGYPQGAGSPHAQFAPTGGMPGSPAMHYGEAPRRQPRRYKTSKCIEKTDRFGATIEKLTFFSGLVFKTPKQQQRKSSLLEVIWSWTVLSQRDTCRLCLSRIPRSLRICDTPLLPVIPRTLRRRVTRWDSSCWTEKLNCLLFWPCIT